MVSAGRARPRVCETILYCSAFPKHVSIRERASLISYGQGRWISMPLPTDFASQVDETEGGEFTLSRCDWTLVGGRTRRSAFARRNAAPPCGSALAALR